VIAAALNIESTRAASVVRNAPHPERSGPAGGAVSPGVPRAWGC